MRAIQLTLMLSLVIVALSGCGKETSTNETTDCALIIKKAGEASDLIIPIRTVIVGGGFDSQNNYYVHGCVFYQEKYGTETGARLNKPIVDITGIEYNDVDYSTEPGRVIEQIVINGLEESLSLGSKIEIKMNQGRYDGTNTLIKGVQIVSYKVPNNNDISRQNKQCDIEIVITTESGDVISLRYAKEAVIIEGRV